MGGLAEFAHENDVEYWDDYDNDGDDFHVSYTGHQRRNTYQLSCPITTIKQLRFIAY